MSPGTFGTQMNYQIFTHIQKTVSLTKVEQEIIESQLNRIIVKKKGHFLEEGKICKSIFFVESGLVRMYCVTEKGHEQTTQFGIQNWWLTDYAAFHTQKASNFSMQALEASVIFSIDHNNYKALLEKVPKLQGYFNLIFQRTCAAFQIRNKYILTNSGESFYHLFREELPEFVQRIPQYILASYLGITPEFLSSIRSRK